MIIIREEEEERSKDAEPQRNVQPNDQLINLF
jgi:hypothetical protein